MSEPINSGLLNPFFNDALTQAWSRESCWPGCAAGYSEDNPSYGNCFVSVLAAWADNGFRDSIIAGKVDETAWHFRLQREGKPIDPTWQQFPEGSVFRALTGGTPDARVELQEVIKGSLEDESLQPRLDHLLTRMKDQSGYETKHNAASIVKKLKQYYTPVIAADYTNGPVPRLSGGPKPG